MSPGGPASTRRLCDPPSARDPADGDDAPLSPMQVAILEELSRHKSPSWTTHVIRSCQAAFPGVPGDTGEPFATEFWRGLHDLDERGIVDLQGQVTVVITHAGWSALRRERTEKADEEGAGNAA